MAIERINHGTWTPQGQTWDDQQRQDFFAKAQAGQGVDGRAGWSWGHDAQGWYQTDDQAAGGGGGGGAAPPPAPPAPGQGPTTPPGEAQRPSPLPPSPPPATAPPQIPLGSTTAQPPATTPGQPNTAPGLIDANAPTPPADNVNAAFKAQLLKLLQANPTDVSLTDPAIAGQSAAFRAAQERGALKSRAELMERASAEGIADSEATRAAARATGERADQAIGANDAALVGQEIEARRGLLMQAAEMANQMGMQQEANDLQRQIANLDAVLKSRGLDLTQSAQTLEANLATLDANTKQYLADLDAKLRREGYSTQERLAQLDAELRKLGINSQFNLGTLELALRDKLGTGELNLGFLNTLLQNEQFNNKLGFDIGAWQSTANANAWLAALGVK